MTVILQDSGGGLWLVTTDINGILFTVSATGAPVNIALADPSGQAWQLGVDTAGVLFTKQVSGFGLPFVILSDAFNTEVSVDAFGVLQTFPGPPPPITSPSAIWIPNGYGAGTDNRIVGGLGGFMAYPQPAFPGGVGPEANGRFGPIDFLYDSSTAQGKGNVFVIHNPGRN